MTNHEDDRRLTPGIHASGKVEGDRQFLDTPTSKSTRESLGYLLQALILPSYLYIHTVDFIYLF